MSLPKFAEAPVPRFQSVDLEALFGPTDRFRLFSEQIYPLLVEARKTLEAEAYCLGHGRSGVEPLWLLGVSLLQFLERVPDRQAVELLRCHLGWNLALRRSV